MSNFIIRQEGPSPVVADNLWEIRLGVGSFLVGALADGRYVLRSVTDPDNRIYESEGKSDDARKSRKANPAVIYFTVEGGIITVGD